MTARRQRGGVGRLALAVLTGLCLALVLVGCATPAAATIPSTPASNGTPGATQPATDPTSGLAIVAVADLPAEASTTLALVDAGGPFPYSQDGVVFQNREGLLPRQPSGFYREYTVETPGSPDRGARRVIVGRAGERYYTADHYASFRRIWP